MPAPGGRGRELVEEREIRASAARREASPPRCGRAPRAPARTGEPPGGRVRSSIPNTVTSRVDRCPHPADSRASSSGDGFRFAPASTCFAQRFADGSARRARTRSATGPGDVFLSHADYAIDWESFKWVVADDAYPTDYEGAVVLDLGAHKGYYGAHALARGARTVISFEPETANLELLERAAAAYRARGARLADSRRRPSERSAARPMLRVMDGSWAHSLHPPDAWAQYEVGDRSACRSRRWRTSSRRLGSLGRAGWSSR